MIVEDLLLGEHEGRRLVLGDGQPQPRQRVARHPVVQQGHVVPSAHHVASVRAGHWPLEEQRLRRRAGPAVEAPGHDGDDRAGLGQPDERLAILLVRLLGERVE